MSITQGDIELRVDEGTQRTCGVYALRCESGAGRITIDAARPPMRGAVEEYVGETLLQRASNFSSLKSRCGCRTWEF